MFSFNQDQDDAVHPSDVAGYVADMLDGLQPFAQNAGLGFLAYLLELARVEAVAERDRQMGPRAV